MDSNEAYFRRRAFQEEAAAASASCAVARKRHEELARLCRARCGAEAREDLRRATAIAGGVPKVLERAS